MFKQLVLHWLLICFQGSFKVLITTFKNVNCLGLGYLMDLLLPYEPALPLRSSNGCLVRVPTQVEVRRVCTTKRGFSVLVAGLWTSLPQEIRDVPLLLDLKFRCTYN